MAQVVQLLDAPSTYKDSRSEVSLFPLKFAALFLPASRSRARIVLTQLTNVAR